jgi:predicted amidohydrolase YtcJ
MQNTITKADTTNGVRQMEKEMQSQRPMTDLVFVNGQVITMDADNRICQGVAISGNQIICVGTSEEAILTAGHDTRVVDLQGKTLLPGFIDSHYHPILNGLFGLDEEAAIIDISYENCPSVDDILTLVRKAADKRPPGTWISMMGYNQNSIAEKRHLIREELDKAAPNHPVQCMHVSGHISIYNSQALATIGVFSPIDAARYPENEIEVHSGRLTGLVYDHTHFLLWSKVGYTEQQQYDAAMKSNDLLLRNGITSVHDPGECGEISYRLMQDLCTRRIFKPRSYMMIHSIFGKTFSLADNKAFIEGGHVSGEGDAYFRYGCCKFMIDGGTSAPSCATREPYSHDPGLPGILGWNREETAEYIEELHRAGCQVTAHAVGDLAVEFMVEGYEKVMNAFHRQDPRHRIEHCAIVNQDLIDRMAALGICPSCNPGFIAWNGSNYTDYYGQRMKYFIALRSMIDAGVRVSISSDAPSGPIEPMAVLDAAVNRIDRITGESVDQTQCITLEEALRLYTINGAIASKEEEIKGSIEVGKLADLVVLSDNLLDTLPHQIREVKIEMTVIDGIIEYEDSSS